MSSARDWRPLVSGVPILGLLALMLLGNRLSVLERRTAEAATGNAASRDTAEAGGEVADDLASGLKAYTGMPAYVDLRESLRRLATVRATVADSPSGTPRLASVERRTSLREARDAVESGVERLRLRVPPDVFPELMMLLADRRDTESIPVSLRADAAPIHGRIE